MTRGLVSPTYAATTSAARSRRAGVRLRAQRAADWPTYVTEILGWRGGVDDAGSERV